MDNKPQKYLQDILNCITSIDQHLQGKYEYTFYLSNKTVRRSVEREMEIIGEAMNCLLKSNPNIAISSARKIIDISHFRATV